MFFGDTLIEEDGFGFVPRSPGAALEKSREIVRRQERIARLSLIMQKKLQLQSFYLNLITVIGKS